MIFQGFKIFKLIFFLDQTGYNYGFTTGRFDIKNYVHSKKNTQKDRPNMLHFYPRKIFNPLIFQEKSIS